VPATLAIRNIRFKHQRVLVPADQSTVQVSLEQDVFNLEAVVVTGQATGVEQRNLANAVTVVNADQLVRAPTQTLESALQGKIPGALIQMNSGAPGGGGQINLRGVTTINAGVDPLIVLDGMVIANDAIASNINAITAAAAGGNAPNQDNSVNRIAHLNPNDIQTIKQLKRGPAAAVHGDQAALYGEQPLNVETDASVIGGNDQTTYFLSGLVRKDGGIAPHSGYQKQALRANLDQVLGSRFKVAVNLNAIHSLSNRAIS